MALVRRRAKVLEENLQEEVFEPPALQDFPLLPEEDEIEARPKARRQLFELDRVFAWGGLVLAVAGLVILLAVASLPGLVLFPGTWQGEQRETYETLRREALYSKVDRAAKTYFLLNGHFPERLKGLVSGHQLAESDLKDPEARPLRYEPEDLSYQLAPVAGGEPMQELGSDEAITGNFLLDFDFYSNLGALAEKPLILLD